MLTGKVALVTGGARGIGEEIVKQLASRGADVAIVDAGDIEVTNETCARITEEYGVKALGYWCNVADFDSVKETVNKIKADLGPVYALVNNAGINRDTLLPMMKPEDFSLVLDVNLKGAFNMIKACSKMFISQRAGRIVNISSVAGLMGNAGQANYSASKAGLIGLTKTAAKEFGARGITVNAVAPGFIATHMTANIQDTVDKMLPLIPLGRMGEPREVAEAVAFLIEADYISGEVIRVDGGMAM